ncbi:hypothetical protein [Phenylobacterium sp.]|uniref:hypothetical protein n=1 Tax=Phenylobacterium sp. TaxID=1871053 RepID=UPI0039599134
MRPAWFPDWTGETAVVVASGPSAAEADLRGCPGRARVIAVNESWRLHRGADVLYACDPGWWVYRHGVPEFEGLRITADAGAAEHFGISHVALQEGQHRILTEPGQIGDGGNSGFQAVNLAVQFGARRIVLVGFDYRGDHWHGRHGGNLANPGANQLAVWSQRLDAEAARLRSLGLEVFNTSPTSALRAYPLRDLASALEP